MVRMTSRERAEIGRLLESGMPVRRIALAVGRPHRTVRDYVEKLRARPSRPRVRSGRQLVVGRA